MTLHHWIETLRDNEHVSYKLISICIYNNKLGLDQKIKKWTWVRRVYCHYEILIQWSIRLFFCGLVLVTIITPYDLNKWPEISLYSLWFLTKVTRVQWTYPNCLVWHTFHYKSKFEHCLNRKDICKVDKPPISLSNPSVPLPLSQAHNLQINLT